MGGKERKSYQNVSGMQTTVLINNSLEIYINLSMTLISSVYRCSWCRSRRESEKKYCRLSWTNGRNRLDRKEFNRSLDFAKLFPKTLNDRLAFAEGRKKWCRKATLLPTHWIRLVPSTGTPSRSPNLQTRPNRCFLFVLVPWLGFWLLFNYK